jgi:hydroxyacylglutathione hydrolase
MFIEQFRFSTDNLGYLVYSKNQAMAIDAGAVEDTIDFAREKNLQIKYVTNTHSHYDHTPGNEALLEKTGATFIDCTKIKSDQTIALDNETVEIFHTPGHTEDSVSFKAAYFLITGDTLFNGTIGNCFSGDLDGFFKSLERLLSFPKETKVYGGHDYVIESMKMSKIIEPDNPDIENYIKKYDSRLIVSCLEDELQANPFVRFNAPSMIKKLEQKKLPGDTALARFKSMYEIY